VDKQDWLMFIKDWRRTDCKAAGVELCDCFNMVPGAGVEPARNNIPKDFKSFVSTNFTTRALTELLKSKAIMSMAPFPYLDTISEKTHPLTFFS
jgi:hypothetical protein